MASDEGPRVGGNIGKSDSASEWNMSVMILTKRVHSQVRSGRILRNSNSIFIAGHDSEVVFNARCQVGHLEAGFLQVLCAFVPCLPVHFPFLHNVVDYGATSVVFWRQPGDLSGGLCDVGCIQASDRTRSICTELKEHSDDEMS